MDIEPERSSHKKRLKKKKKHLKKHPPTLDKVVKTGDQAVDEALEKMVGFSNALKDQINEVYAKGNITAVDIENYLSDSTRFSNTQYETIQRDRQKLLESIWTKLGKKAKETHTKKKDTQASKRRSRKFIGSRKNWISMR